MKKYILSVIILCAATVGFSQAKISAGVLYGVSTSTFAGKSAENVDWRAGDRFGVILNFAPTENFSIEPQFLVTKKGADINTELGNTEVQITYAELPILFNIRIPLSETIYPTVFGGPYFATRLSQKQNIVYATEEEIIINEVDLKSGDIGASFGVGVDLVGNRFFLSLNARADYGTTRIGNGEFTPDLKNRSYSLNGILGFVLIE